MDRWNMYYHYDPKICDASDTELAIWARDSAWWDEFSLGCLRDICWRHDIDFDRYIEAEDILQICMICSEITGIEI